MATAYKGYLIKTKHGIVPNKYLINYSSIPDQEQDINSYTDGNGLTHRTILPHTKSNITFATKPCMDLYEKIEFMQHFPSRTKVVLTYWNDQINDYKEGNFYIPPISYTVKDADSKTISYDSIPMELIEY